MSSKHIPKQQCGRTPDSERKKSISNVQGFALGKASSHCIIPTPIDSLIFTFFLRLQKSNTLSKKKVKDAETLVKQLEKSLQSRCPEDWPFITKLTEIVQVETVKSLNVVEVLDGTFHAARFIPKNERSAAYMVFDDLFLRSSITPLSYMSDDSSSAEEQDYL